MANTESVVTKIQADISNLQKGLRVAGGEVATFSSKTEKAFGAMRLGIVGAATAAAAGLFALTKQAIDSAAAIGHSAKQAGLSSDAYQRYSFALGQSNIRQEEFTIGVAKMTTELGKAHNGIQSSSDKFKDLGLNIYDASGKAKSSDQILVELLDSLGDISDDATRAAYAAAIFGETVGPKLAAATAQGSGGIKELAGSISTISDENIKTAQKVQDDWDKLTTQIGNWIKERILNTLSAAGFAATSGPVTHTGPVNRQAGALQEAGRIFPGSGLPPIGGSTSPFDRLSRVLAKPENSQASGETDEQRAKRLADEDKLKKAAEQRAAEDKRKLEAQQKYREELGKEQADHAAILDLQMQGNDALVAELELEQRLRDMRAKGASEEQIAREARLGQLESEQEALEAIEERQAKSREQQHEYEVERRKEAEQAQIEAIQGLSDAFGDLATNGEEAWDRIKQRAIAAIAEIVLKLAISRIFGGAQQPAFSLGTIFNAQGYARGGNPPLGRPSIVGEEGPEWFVPSVPGRVVPMGGGSGAPVVNVAGPQITVVTEPGMTTQQERRRTTDGRDEIRIMVKAALQDELSRNGSTNRSIAKQSGNRVSPKKGVS